MGLFNLVRKFSAQLLNFVREFPVRLLNFVRKFPVRLLNFVRKFSAQLLKSAREFPVGLFNLVREFLVGFCAIFAQLVDFFAQVGNFLAQVAEFAALRQTAQGEGRGDYARNSGERKGDNRNQFGCFYHIAAISRPEFCPDYTLRRGLRYRQ